MERARAKNGGAKTSSFILSNTLGQSFRIGFLNVRFYSITFVLGIAVAYFISRARALKAGITEKVFDEIVFWTVLWGFVIARIYYVLFYFDQYKDNLNEIYKIWHGGLAIYGGLIGGTVAAFLLCRKYKINFFSFSDCVVLALPAAQAIGRLGNFFNYEAFGRPTSLPWKMFIPEPYRPSGYQNFSYFHPTFLYEALANIILLALLWIFARKAKPGLLTAAYIVGYSVIRFFIEAIRLDSAYFGPFRGDQITALAGILLGLFIMAKIGLFRYNKA